jgi:hypothetical protein
MDHYKTVVMDFLQSDRAVFVNEECCIDLHGPAHLHGTIHKEKRGEHCACDAVAIDLRHGAVFLVETALEDGTPALLRKLAGWTKHWDQIKATLHRECRVPAEWRVHVWLFVPRTSIETLDEKLEHMRQTTGSRFKVKITALEDVQPWRSASWERHEEAWETVGVRALS